MGGGLNISKPGSGYSLGRVDVEAVFGLFRSFRVNSGEIVYSAIILKTNKNIITVCGKNSARSRHGARPGRTVERARRRRRRHGRRESRRFSTESDERSSVRCPSSNCSVHVLPIIPHPPCCVSNIVFLTNNYLAHFFYLSWFSVYFRSACADNVIIIIIRGVFCLF